MMNDTTQSKPNYKKSLNLPRTSFAMKANLVQNEPASLKRWLGGDLYRQLRQARKGSQPYIFHDGPPYANGSIHLGHLLNKVLKDFVVRSKTMAGYDCPFVPGWDCHGLPIEHKVVSEQVAGDDAAGNAGADAAGAGVMKTRRKCKAYAEKYVKLQAQQMQRLLTLADYDDPYLTMDKRFEAGVLEVFAELVERGLIYRGLKPVHWSIDNRTALAEAELEYDDREDSSVYVLFEIDNRRNLPELAEVPVDEPAYLMIWTTTPWTLPANLAVAVAPRAYYGMYRFDHDGRTRYAMIADDLASKVLQAGGATNIERLAGCTGEQLVSSKVTYTHPLLNDEKYRPLVAADYVTLEDGTGLVHTAPGHGVEDYQTGQREKLEIYCPVRGNGTFDDTVPDWLQGKNVWDANPLICDKLVASGHMFHQHAFTHSYPHDWRSKTPVIFRATEQWFVHVDKPFDSDVDNALEEGQGPRSLRERAMQETESDVKFIPAWGRNRMRGMIESRPDWCLSRQRAWGLPIPVFFNGKDAKNDEKDGGFLLTKASVLAVAEALRHHGSDYWFTASPADLLAAYVPANDDDAPQWVRDMAPNFEGLTKGQDIFDVWFESGSSWHAAIRSRFGDACHPTDLYLEGSDQHRGWFQLSLLPSLGATGKSPFKTVLTHGFMVDKDGRKMSKSLGNTIEVEDLLKELGADVCRWWVASLNTDNDVKVDWQFFKLAGEEYRKVRNTVRFLLSNLGDFDAQQHMHDFTDADAASIDAWALDELMDLVDDVRQQYDRFAFRKAQESLYNFCNETLSAVYLAAVKDRLYCDRPDAPRRRRTQTAMFRIADALIRLLAPLLPHTADEAWAALLHKQPGEVESIHLQLLPEPQSVVEHEDWAVIMRSLDGWMKALEQARQQRDIDNPLDCGLRVTAWTGEPEAFDPADLADLCGVSRFEIVAADPDADADAHAADQAGVVEVLDLRDQPRCDRSWKRDGTVKQRTDGGMLSNRDAAALEVE